MNKKIEEAVKEFYKRRSEIVEEFMRKIEIARLETTKVMVNDKEYDLNDEEIKVVDTFFGTHETASNCCYARIGEDGICSDCKEHAEKILIYRNL